MDNRTDSITKAVIKHEFNEFKSIPARNPLQAASGRARFLRDAASYQQAVSTRKHSRQIGWIFKTRKEKLAMNVFVSLLLAASLLLGGGATVSAAQDDLPTQSLYQLKLWTENAALAMKGDPQEQASQLMTMAQTRIQEMAALSDQGAVIPDQLRLQLEQHLRQVLQLAASMDDATCEQTLLQLRDRLQEQDRIMDQLQTYANSDNEPLLTQTRLILQTQLRLVENGLADPQGFRNLIQSQFQYGQDETVQPAPNANQQGEPAYQQNGPNPDPGEGSGAGTGSQYGNDTPGEPNVDQSQSGNDDKGSGEPNGGSGPTDSQGGNSTGSDNGSGSGSGSGSDSGSGSGGSSGGGSGGSGGN